MFNFFGGGAKIGFVIRKKKPPRRTSLVDVYSLLEETNVQ